MADANGSSCTVCVAPASAESLALDRQREKGKDGLSLADARLKAAGARKKLAEGKDPTAERRAEKVAAITFGEFADALPMSLIG